MNWKIVSILVVVVLLNGCMTPYQPNGLGGGYTDMPLSRDMYKVSFRGNAYTSQDAVQNMILKRCSELTLNSGYKYFIIVASGDNVNTSYYQTATTITSSGTGSYSGYGNAYANGGYAYNGYGATNTFSTINPGQTFVFNRHTLSVIIKMLKTNKGMPLAFSAQTIFQST